MGILRSGVILLYGVSDYMGCDYRFIGSYVVIELYREGRWVVLIWVSLVFLILINKIIMVDN